MRNNSIYRISFYPPYNDIEAKATYQNSPRNRINKKTGSMIKNQ